MKISFFVSGKAAPGGSKKAIPDKATGKIHIVDDAKGNAAWKRTVAKAGRKAYSGPLLVGPVEVEMSFIRTRPKCHYRTGKNSHLLKSDAPDFPTVKPDVLKLARSTEDALTGVIWHDDAATVRLSLSKDYGSEPGVKITVWTMEGE